MGWNVWNIRALEPTHGVLNCDTGPRPHHGVKQEGHNLQTYGSAHLGVLYREERSKSGAYPTTFRRLTSARGESPLGGGRSALRSNGYNRAKAGGWSLAIVSEPACLLLATNATRSLVAAFQS